MKIYLICTLFLMLTIAAYSETKPQPLQPTHDIAVHPGFIWANIFDDGEIRLAAQIFNPGSHREYVHLRFLEIRGDQEVLLDKVSVRIPAGDMQLVTIPWEGDFTRHQIAVQVEINERVMERLKENNYAVRWIEQIPGKGFSHENPAEADWSLPFVPDVYTPGTWVPVRKVNQIDDFDPYQYPFSGTFSGPLTFCIRGEIEQHLGWRWIKGYLISPESNIVRRYCIKEIRNMHYLFLEWPDPADSPGTPPSFRVYVRATPPLQEHFPGLEFTPEPKRFLYSGTT